MPDRRAERRGANVGEEVAREQKWRKDAERGGGAGGWREQRADTLARGMASQPARELRTSVVVGFDAAPQRAGAAEEGDVERVRQILAMKPKVDTEFALAENNFTPLSAAGYRGQTEVVKLLLAAGANVNAKSKQKNWYNTACNEQCSQ